MPQGYNEQPEYRPEGTDAQLEELVGAERVDRSALPAAERTPVITDAQAEAREIHDGYNFWSRRRRIYAAAKEARFSESESDYYNYKPRPLWQIGLFGVSALALFAGQWFMPEINEALGDPFGWSIAGKLGIIRMLMMFAGAFCAFMAWPKYQHVNHSDEETAALAKYKADFRRKFGR